MPATEIDNFSIQQESNGLALLCNNFRIISEIPTKDIAIDVVLELKKTSVDWDKFNGILWIPEQLEIANAIKKVEVSHSAIAKLK